MDLKFYEKKVVDTCRNLFTRNKSKKMIVVLASVILVVTGCSAASLENVGKEVQDTIDDLEDSNNKYVKMVKGGYRESDPDLTYDQAFSAFFATPRWNYFKGEDGQDVVEFTGDCIYQDVAVKARIQFVVDEENGTFETTYLAFNEVPQNKLILAGLMANVFGYDEIISEETAYSDNSVFQNEEGNDAGADEMLEEEARELVEQWFEENPLIYYDYEIELSEKYPSGPKYGGFWYDLYIGNLFYDMIYVDAETGELVMGEGDINTPMDKWYAETWLPYLDGDNGGAEEPAYGYKGDVADSSGSYTDYQEWGGWYDDGWETELQLGLYSDGSQDPECGGMTTYFRGMVNTGDLYYLGDNAFRWESEGYESSNPETYYVYAVYEDGEYQLMLYNSDGNYEMTFTLYEQYIP